MHEYTLDKNQLVHTLAVVLGIGQDIISSHFCFHTFQVGIDRYLLWHEEYFI